LQGQDDFSADLKSS